MKWCVVEDKNGEAVLLCNGYDLYQRFDNLHHKKGVVNALQRPSDPRASQFSQAQVDEIDELMVLSPTEEQRDHREITAVLNVLTWQLNLDKDLISEVKVVTKDELLVAFVRLDRQFTLAIYGDSKKELVPFVKGAVMDAKEILFATHGPKILEWVLNQHKLQKTIEPLLLSSVKELYGQERKVMHEKQNHGFLKMFILLSRLFPCEDLFAAPNLCWNLEEEPGLEGRQGFEEAMDVLETSMESCNDTLDESDLCLPIGIALIVDGMVLHSSLNQYDLHDVYRYLLLLKGVEDDAKSFLFYSCVDRKTGVRLPMRRCFTDDAAIFEKRVVTYMTLQNITLVKLMISQHPEVHGSGHVDPYGLLEMERSLQELVKVLKPFRFVNRNPASCLLDKFLVWGEKDGGDEETEEEQSEPIRRPRSKSEEGLMFLWGQLKRVGSSFRNTRRRSSSLDLSALEDESSKKSPQISHEEKLQLVSLRIYEPIVWELMVHYLGAVKNGRRRPRMEHVQPEEEEPSYNGLDDLVHQRLGISLDELEQQFF